MSSANRAASNGHSQASCAQPLLALRSDRSVFSGKLIHRLIATGMVWPTRVTFTPTNSGPDQFTPNRLERQPRRDVTISRPRRGLLPSSKSRRFNGLRRDEIGLNHHRALAPCLSMIFSENRFTLFRIML
ncbi:hypothetical protein [Bradyrhizobium brasilense]|uniref:hypothetical protein n=1 Tax=Bradyrhizobium brasilense TaxID=1419277 RepID=UPI00115FAF9C|nr:hypothetical protein [Bradyrhizobium brasilense]MCC8969587.1 hypothetical protein [Bradyrhizobium brasilense]